MVGSWMVIARGGHIEGAADFSANWLNGGCRRQGKEIRRNSQKQKESIQIKISFYMMQMVLMLKK